MDAGGKVNLKLILGTGRMACMKSTLSVPDARDAILWLGTSGAYKIWIDGKELAAREIAARKVEAGTDTVFLRLNKGDNELAISVAAGPKAWACSVSLSDVEDEAIEGLEVKTSRP